MAALIKENTCPCFYMKLTRRIAGLGMGLGVYLHRQNLFKETDASISIDSVELSQEYSTLAVAYGMSRLIWESCNLDT